MVGGIVAVIMAGRRRLAALNTSIRNASARHRVLPSFLVLGAQKAGTTSLWSLLHEHPAILGPRFKEVNYFDKGWTQGLDHYRAVFPLRAQMTVAARRGDGPAMTFDSTPSYIYHPRVPGRVKETLPDSKFIALLRDPTERAYSHYLHAVAIGRETLRFDEALAAEADGRRDGDDDRKPRELWAATKGLPYVARGRYIDQLERWWNEFPRERFLLIKSEDFFADPAATMSTITDFLGLEPHAPKDTAPKNQSGGPPLDPALRAELDAGFADDNRRLFDATGIDFRKRLESEPIGLT